MGGNAFTAQVPFFIPAHQTYVLYYCWEGQGRHFESTRLIFIFGLNDAREHTDWRKENCVCTFSIAPSILITPTSPVSTAWQSTPQLLHWSAEVKHYLQSQDFNASTLFCLLFFILFCFVFSSQLCWPCISCISYIGMKTPPRLCTMPSAASVISLPSSEQPLLTHGWENSSKNNGRSHLQKFYRFNM
jgi:hypothetical protein